MAVDPIRDVIGRNRDPVSLGDFWNLIRLTGNGANDHIVFEPGILDPDVLGLPCGNTRNGGLHERAFNLRHYTACVVVESSAKLWQPPACFFYRGVHFWIIARNRNRVIHEKV
jgi:hypothetical protein